MSGKVFYLLLLTNILVSFKKFKTGDQPINPVIAQFDKAEHLYNLENSNSRTDSISLNIYKQVLTELENQPRTALTDSLHYESNYKCGVLSEVYKKFQQATIYYLKGATYGKSQEQQNRMYVFAGAGYYYQNNFDSASYFLRLAEANAGSLHSNEDRMRLYNTLGVLYFDNGNFLQSKSYFIHAFQLTREVKPIQEQNLISIQLNMAICYYKLGMFDKALDLYHDIEKKNLVWDELSMNMGITYSRTHHWAEAIRIFKKVKQEKYPGVLNEIARVYMEDNKSDSALAFLNQYQIRKKILSANTLEDGINNQYRGDLEILRSNPDSALNYYQAALVCLSRNFSNRDTRINPDNFAGSFAYIRTFDVLDKKAKAWTARFVRTKSPEDLQSAFDTYQSAISLISYVEKSYETDDAKIFLKEKTGTIYVRALQVCLELDSIFPKQHYMEKAFLITERNKASVMSAEIKQKNFANSDSIGRRLLKEERNIKYNLARLNGKTDQHLTDQELKSVYAEISNYESGLASVRRQMEQNSKFLQIKYADDFPSISSLQDHISNGQALISFYNTPETIEVFVLKKNALEHICLNNAIQIRDNLTKWTSMLQTIENGHRSKMSELKSPLLKDLVNPILRIAGKQEKWIVVPDGIFFLVSFESLPGNENGEPLIEQHEISYQFSSRFVIHDQRLVENAAPEVLSFAPFAGNETGRPNTGDQYFAKLSYSREEISNQPGMRFLGEQATKVNFLKNLNRYRVLHLATHAIADLDDPSGSFIAFYPSSGNRNEDFLFQEELYRLSMDSCRLVVISACETGRGKLVSDEGVMSFARAFLYAGCPATINTLWKADDQSTALIVKNFYNYLDAGYTTSAALRRAKLDFIHENPLYRNPAYWAHLVLTGNPDAIYEKKRTWLGFAFGICFSTIFIFVVQGIRKRSRRFP